MYATAGSSTEGVGASPNCDLHTLVVVGWDAGPIGDLWCFACIEAGKLWLASKVGWLYQTHHQILEIHNKIMSTTP